MKRLSTYIFILLFVLPYISDAQRWKPYRYEPTVSTSVYGAQQWKRYRYEPIGGIGTVNIFGDLGGGAGDARHNTLDFDIEGTRPAVMVAMRYKLKELLALKANLFLAYGNSSDDHTANEARANRGATTNTFFY